MLKFFIDLIFFKVREIFFWEEGSLGSEGRYFKVVRGCFGGKEFLVLIWERGGYGSFIFRV